jgi:hypothetical protein
MASLKRADYALTVEASAACCAGAPVLIKARGSAAIPQEATASARSARERIHVPAVRVLSMRYVQCGTCEPETAELDTVHLTRWMQGAEPAALITRLAIELGTVTHRSRLLPGNYTPGLDNPIAGMTYTVYATGRGGRRGWRRRGSLVDTHTEGGRRDLGVGEKAARQNGSEMNRLWT